MSNSLIPTYRIILPQQYIRQPKTPPSNSALFLISSNSAKYSAPSNKLFELRKIDYKNFPIFALAFIKLQDEDEVFKVLNMDFNKYIEV